eukprot:2719571-Amphidinium_carterae.1
MGKWTAQQIASVLQQLAQEAGASKSQQQQSQKDKKTGSAKSNMAKSADGQQPNRNKSSAVQRGRGGKQQLDEKLLQKRWHQCYRNSQLSGHRKPEQMCTTCLSTNWCEKDTCRSCGQSLAGSWFLQSGRWPPVGCPPEIVAKRDNYGTYDSAGSGTAPPSATGGSIASEHAQFISQSHVANHNMPGR